MSVADTSIERYKELVAEGAVNRQQALILCKMQPGASYTRSELSDITKLQINAVCGRVFELVRDMRLEEGTPRKCKVTGNTAKTVRLPMVDGA